MTPHELYQKLIDNKYPLTYEVDAATYGLVCQMIFNDTAKLKINYITRVDVSVGLHNGIMFKNTELILKVDG